MLVASKLQAALQCLLIHKSGYGALLIVPVPGEARSSAAVCALGTSSSPEKRAPDSEACAVQLVQL